MTGMETVTDMATLVARIERLLAADSGRRVLIGIVGAPGSGKTTLAEGLVEAILDQHPAADADHSCEAEDEPRRRWIGSVVAQVPMDGFHLADVELRRLDRTARKGAPDTFDAGGYLVLLRRLSRGGEDVWAPAFDRRIEQPIAGSIPVLRSTRVIITEGNYLLLDEPAWTPIRELLDEVWYVDVDEDERIKGLIARHERFGKTPEQARAWVSGPDQRNAELIHSTRSRADLILAGELTRRIAPRPGTRSA